MAKKRAKWALLGVVIAIFGFIYFYIRTKTAPTPSGSEFYIRYDRPTPLADVLQDMERRGVIRDADAMRLIATLLRHSSKVPIGTYQVRPGLEAIEFLDRLQKPVVLKVRIPETNWALRTANLLETRYQVCSARDYMALVHNPAAFSNVVSFPLPKDSLEGYLYPDTYELAPLIGARTVIERQLKAFQTKIWDAFGHPANLPRVLNVAAMVELESGPDTDRPRIAGVIENRLAQHMRLQIDATILYGLQKWRRMTFADYKQKTPYNTYTHAGLPPGPICSPDAKSVAAALRPNRAGKYVFYIAMPDGHTAFSATYAQHLRNIHLRNAERKAVRG